MTKSEIEISLTTNLKRFLKSEGHIDSGDLYKSISINLTENGSIDISTLDYLQYLDDGKFLDNFLDLPSTIDLLEEYAVYLYSK